MFAIEKPRINKYDNLKGFAIILIVFGHFMVLANENLIAIHNFISIIDLPIFFFVSGYFSKISPKEPLKSFKRLMIPYLILCIFMRLKGLFVLGTNYSYPLFISTEFGLWFLISLFTMKLSLPIFDKLKYPVLIAIFNSLLIGLLGIDSEILGITRTFSYLPIFLIGFYYDEYTQKVKNRVSNINTLFSKKTVIILFALLVLILAIVSFKLDIYTVSFTKTYDLELITAIKDLIKTSIVIFCGIIFTLLLNNLITNNNSILTKIGKNSMVVYLLHLFIVPYVQELIKNIILYHNLNDLIFYLGFDLIFTFVIVFILSLDIFTKGYNKLIDFIFDLCFINK